MVFERGDAPPLIPVLKITTQGRKAWSFFDREMVALGAGISSPRDTKFPNSPASSVRSSLVGDEAPRGRRTLVRPASATQSSDNGF
jgi:hypothetical protein